MAFVGLDRLINPDNNLLQTNKKKLLWIFGIPAALLALFYLSPSSFNQFISDAEYDRIRSQLVQAKWPEQNMSELFNNIEIARIEVFKADVLRSFLFILATGLIIYLFSLKKLSRNYVIGGVAVLVLFDMWNVNRRYLNEDDFVRKQRMEVPFQKTVADQQILADTDPNYRVLNLSVNTFNDASTSYYHKSVGGYHAAKLMRYQELIDYHISKQNMKVLNMLNTKYVIVRGENGPQAQQNPGALGNAWFVGNYSIVENADEEILSLNDFEPSQEAVIDKRYTSQISDLPNNQDVIGSIELTSYEPNRLVYRSQSNKEALGVFSEIYYEAGWNAYIDGELNDHFRVNYVLRGLIIPQGEHEIEFKFEPVFYSTSNIISGIFSVLLILSLLFIGYKAWRNLGNEPDEG